MSHGSVLVFGLGGVCIALPVTCSASPAVFQPPFWISCAVSPVCGTIAPLSDCSFRLLFVMFRVFSMYLFQEFLVCYTFAQVSLLCRRLIVSASSHRWCVSGLVRFWELKAWISHVHISERNRSVCSMRTSSNSLLWHPRSQLKLEGVIDFLIELGGSLLFLYRNSNKWIK